MVAADTYNEARSTLCNYSVEELQAEIERRDMPPKIVSMADLGKALPPCEKRCWIEDDVIILALGGTGRRYHYPIDADRCDTAEKVLSWVNHLVSKVTVDTVVIEQFLRVVSKRWDLDLHVRA